jgi:hypothetical protein
MVTLYCDSWFCLLMVLAIVHLKISWWVRDGFCTKRKLKEFFKDLAASRRISKKGWWSWVIVFTVPDRKCWKSGITSDVFTELVGWRVSHVLLLKVWAAFLQIGIYQESDILLGQSKIMIWCRICLNSMLVPLWAAGMHKLFCEFGSQAGCEKPRETSLLETWSNIDKKNTISNDPSLNCAGF